MLATLCLWLQEYGHSSLVYARGAAPVAIQYAETSHQYSTPIQYTDTGRLHRGVPNTEHMHNQNVSAAADDLLPRAATVSDAVTLPTAPSVIQRNGADSSHLLYLPNHTTSLPFG